MLLYDVMMFTLNIEPCCETIKISGIDKSDSGPYVNGYYHLYDTADAGHGMYYNWMAESGVALEYEEPCETESDRCWSIHNGRWRVSTP